MAPVVSVERRTSISHKDQILSSMTTSSLPPPSPLTPHSFPSSPPPPPPPPLSPPQPPPSFLDWVEIIIFVENLPKNMGWRVFFSLFRPFECVTDVFIPMKHSRFGSKFGFVQFDSEVAADLAVLKVDGLKWKDRLLHVKKAAFGRNGASLRSRKETPLSGVVKENASSEKMGCNEPSSLASSLFSDLGVKGFSVKIGKHRSLLVFESDEGLKKALSLGAAWSARRRQGVRLLGCEDFSNNKQKMLDRFDPHRFDGPGHSWEGDRHHGLLLEAGTAMAEHEMLRRSLGSTELLSSVDRDNSGGSLSTQSLCPRLST
ncbi:hypothetical protein Dimus_017345 [Dionaea muscipula]